MNAIAVARRIALCASLLLASGLAAGQVTFSGSGIDAAAITPTRDAFRVALGGGSVAGANGSFGGVRREINWDGVPAAFAAPNLLPANFFNVNSPRGVIFATPGTGLQVSGATTDAGAGQPAAADFGNLDPSYAATFAPFSPQRLFTAIGSNVVDVTFVLPGTSSPAVTTGFGAIFSDVDLANTTSIQFFDSADVSLGTFNVPAAGGSEAFSFLGVVFPSAVVARVRITSGNAALAAGATDQNGDTRDVVAMDDFLYGEPVLPPVPDLTIAKSHGGSFTQGQVGATYAITVTNAGTAPTSGTVTVTDTVPSGLTPTGASGTGWTCGIALQVVTCTRADALAAAASYPAIALVVDVDVNAPTGVVNTASVSGGGETDLTDNTAADPTSIFLFFPPARAIPALGDAALLLLAALLGLLGFRVLARRL